MIKSICFNFTEEVKQNDIFVLFVCFLQITSSDNLTISKDGCFHRLKILKVSEENAGKYKFEADGRKTEGEIVVEGKKKNSRPYSINQHQFVTNKQTLNMFLYPPRSTPI